MMSGDEWYFLEAIRAINQCIGRVIRHKDDYGVILLCDYRFNQPRQKSQLSSWIQCHLKEAQPTTFGPTIGAVSRFFRNAERTVRTFRDFISIIANVLREASSTRTATARSHARRSISCTETGAHVSRFIGRNDFVQVWSHGENRFVGLASF